MLYVYRVVISMVKEVYPEDSQHWPSFTSMMYACWVVAIMVVRYILEIASIGPVLAEWCMLTELSQTWRWGLFIRWLAPAQHWLNDVCLLGCHEHGYDVHSGYSQHWPSIDSIMYDYWVVTSMVVRFILETVSIGPVLAQWCMSTRLAQAWWWGLSWRQPALAQCWLNDVCLLDCHGHGGEVYSWIR